MASDVQPVVPSPGPWIFDDLSQEIVAADGGPVAAPPEGYIEAQWQVDAPVIAATCELLDVAKVIALTPEIRKFLEANDPKALRQLTRAIDKAEQR